MKGKCLHRSHFRAVAGILFAPGNPDEGSWPTGHIEEASLALNLLKDTGVPLARQRSTRRELVQLPYSKLDDDAFTQARVILMYGIESEAMRLGHVCARMNSDLQLVLAPVRRIEQHQQTLVNWAQSGRPVPA